MDTTNTWQCSTNSLSLFIYSNVIYFKNHAIFFDKITEQKSYIKKAATSTKRTASAAGKFSLKELASAESNTTSPSSYHGNLSETEV